MVENELPLASVNVQSTSTFDKRSRSSGNMTDSQDEIEVITEQENNNNNINNINNVNSTPSDHIYFREKSNNAVNVEVNEKKASGDISQNVYSNIPPTSPPSSSSSSNVPTILKNAAADHVYSNIDETVAVNGTNARFLSDNLDLDLDDPLLTSSFIKKKEIPNNQHQNIYNTSSSSHVGGVVVSNVNDSHSNKINLPSISSSSSTNGTQVTSIELKNVLSAVALQKSNQVAVVVEPTLSIGPALRQETMIDTALDLDSLDGSQVGLMKTM